MQHGCAWLVIDAAVARNQFGQGLPVGLPHKVLLIHESKRLSESQAPVKATIRAPVRAPIKAPIQANAVIKAEVLIRTEAPIKAERLIHAQTPIHADAVIPANPPDPGPDPRLDPGHGPASPDPFHDPPLDPVAGSNSPQPLDNEVEEVVPTGLRLPCREWPGGGSAWPRKGEPCVPTGDPEADPSVSRADLCPGPFE